ncbi:hypothetical protein [Bradyrhizobium sp. WSM1417]|uniref:hypothetical protein n=1 Tax=Bradyrhizobium sp. WSM1417 TaxID=754500 RepID=UPI0004861271|nr:hypothetical protein [Bradyrhizobium sp. WSM1417]
MSALTYLAVWRLISGRIRGIEKAALVHAGFLAGSGKSAHGADKDLQRHCVDILDSIEKFQKSFGKLLPDAAHIAIESFVADAGSQIRGNTAGDAMLVRTVIVKLVAFEAEMTFCLNSPTESVRSASELAFMHLQRLIVVDEEYRNKWQTAFATHETHCERLGGVHLLWHGIWAFKVDASGGKTDLVYQEPLRTGTIPVALGMVLTEWKRAASKAEEAFADAKQQAAIYSGGVLGGVELATHRYLVIVTKNQIVPPADIIDGGVVYRHINIAVDPQSPSVTARKLAK